MQTKGTLRVNDWEICFKSNLLVQVEMLRHKPTQLMEDCSTGRHRNCLQNPESSIMLFCGLEDNVRLEDWQHIFKLKLKVTKIQICTLSWHGKNCIISKVLNLCFSNIHAINLMLINSFCASSETGEEASHKSCGFPPARQREKPLAGWWNVQPQMLTGLLPRVQNPADGCFFSFGKQWISLAGLAGFFPSTGFVQGIGADFGGISVAGTVP